MIAREHFQRHIDERIPLAMWCRVAKASVKFVPKHEQCPHCDATVHGADLSELNRILETLPPAE